LKKALIAAGIQECDIEINKTAQPLKDYLGNTTKYRWKDAQDVRFKDCDKAHVIVRRKVLGHANNDFGIYIDPKGGSVSFLCDYSRQATPFNDTWLNKIKQEYAYEKTKKHYAALGKQVHRVDEGKQIHVFVKG
jgi:hypothetical protein